MLNKTTPRNRNTLNPNTPNPISSAQGNSGTHSINNNTTTKGTPNTLNHTTHSQISTTKTKGETFTTEDKHIHNKENESHEKSYHNTTPQTHQPLLNDGVPLVDPLTPNYTIFSQTNTTETNDETNTTEEEYAHTNEDEDDNKTYNSTLSQVEQLLQDERVTLVDPPISSILTTIRHPLKGSLRTITFNCNKGLRDKIPQAADYARRATADILHLVEPFDEKVFPTEHEVARHIKQARKVGYELHSSKYSVLLLKNRLAHRMIGKPDIKHDGRLIIC